MYHVFTAEAYSVVNRHSHDSDIQSIPLTAEKHKLR